MDGILDKMFAGVPIKVCPHLEDGTVRVYGLDTFAAEIQVPNWELATELFDRIVCKDAGIEYGAGKLKRIVFHEL